MTMSDSLEQEPLTRLNIVTNNSSSEDASGKLTVLAEANPISLSRMDSNTSSHIKSDTATDVRKVSVAKSNGDESGDDVDFEVTLPKGEERGDETHDNPDEASVPLGAGGKKKRKKKPKSQRGLKNPTGFEEYYVDPPVTPAEFEEERSLYDISLPFAQRIERGIQRFLAKRNLDSTRKNLFDKYLVHGGIEAGPNMFSGGLDTETLETKNAAEIAELRATTFVGMDKIDIGKADHVVDFEGCLGSFLAHTLPAAFELHSEEKIKYLIGIIRNFLNYLLHHDVCPDYEDQVYAARTLCDKAEKELWSISQCKSMLPGDFNRSCSEIFGGMYQGMWSKSEEWMQGLDLDCDKGISPDHARKVFKYAMAAAADDDTHEIYRSQLEEKSTKVASVDENAGFEVTEIIFPTQDILDFYAQPEAAGLKPVGRLIAKTWNVPTAAEEDLTEEEEAELAAKTPEIKHYEFWVEADILALCVVGMKVEATITKLSFGVSYFDAFFGVHCSFYQLLPNELMAGWRTPEKEWLPMRKRSPGADNLDYDDLPGDVGGDNKTVDASTVSNKQLVDNTRNGMDAPGDGDASSKIKENGAHEIEGDGNGDGSGKRRVTAMEIADFAVDVRETGEKIVRVPGNAEGVVEKIFDVVPRRYED